MADTFRTPCFTGHPGRRLKHRDTLAKPPAVPNLDWPKVHDALNVYEAGVHLEVSDHGKRTVEADYVWRQDLDLHRMAYNPEPNSIRPRYTAFSEHFYPEFKGFDGRLHWMYFPHKDFVRIAGVPDPDKQRRFRLEKLEDFITFAPTSLICHAGHLSGRSIDRLEFRTSEDVLDGRPAIRIEAVWFAGTDQGNEREVMPVYIAWLEPAWQGLPTRVQQLTRDPTHPTTLDGVHSNLPIATHIRTEATVQDAIKIKEHWFPVRGQVASYRMGQPNGNIVAFTVDPETIRLGPHLWDESAFRPPAVGERTEVAVNIDRWTVILRPQDHPGQILTSLPPEDVIRIATEHRSELEAAAHEQSDGSNGVEAESPLP